MKNNNQAIIRRITNRALFSDKQRNFFLIAAIALTSFMITAVFSVGMSYYEQRKKSNISMEFNGGDASSIIILGVIAALLGIAGFLFIYNVMYISISKDVRFYGMLKTLGTTPKQLRRIIQGQVFRLCIIGIPVGLFAGAIISLTVLPNYIEGSGIQQNDAVVSFSPVIYTGAVLFTILTVCISTFAPVKRAADISPIEAMKYESMKLSDGASFNHKTRTPVNGRPSKIALRNIFRERKRAFAVFLSLFMGLTIFTIVTTIVSSRSIDDLLDLSYDYDLSVVPYGGQTIDNAFVNKASELDGVEDIFITTMPGQGGYGQFAHVETAFSLRGVSPKAIEINKSLSNAIDLEAFECGEIVIINTWSWPRNSLKDSGILDNFEVGSVYDILIGSEMIPVQVELGGFAEINPSRTIMSSGGFSSSRQVGGSYNIELEVLVSNTFMEQYFGESNKIVGVDLNVAAGYDKLTYDKLNEMLNDPFIASRFEGYMAYEEAETTIIILGGGIAVILALIGVFNFINVMSSGVVARKREFAILESVGMSKNQIRMTLRYEGVFYWIITVFFSVIIGNASAYSLFLLIKKSEPTIHFIYPLIPTLVLYVSILAICIIVPELAYRNISKMTLIERLRETE